EGGELFASGVDVEHRPHRTPVSSPRDARVLVLVEVGPLDQFEDAVDVGRLSLAHQTYEDGLVAHDQGGDSEDIPALDRLLVLLPQESSRLAGGDGCGDGVGITPGFFHSLSQDGLVTDVEALVVT